MVGERVFPVEKMAKLDSPERQARQPARPLIDLLAGYQPKRVLEVGVGTGYIAIPFSMEFPDAVVVGIDVESQMLDVFTERAASLGLSNVRVASTVPGRIPFLDDSVDATLMVNLYHELDDRPKTLLEAHRVLNPGGRLIICDWDPERTTDAGPPREHCVPAEVAKRELEGAGFDGIAQYSLYEDFWVVTARRH
jgi:ubiquinone/menaquinone biosynthesis C-methylase UbiE